MKNLPSRSLSKDQGHRRGLKPPKMKILDCQGSIEVQEMCHGTTFRIKEILNLLPTEDESQPMTRQPSSNHPNDRSYYTSSGHPCYWGIAMTLGLILTTLKAAGLKYAAVPSNFGAVLQMGGFRYLEEACSSPLSDLLETITVVEIDPNQMPLKRRGNSVEENEADDDKRELVFKEDGQEYAQVLRVGVK